MDTGILAMKLFIIAHQDKEENMAKASESSEPQIWETL
jgi:hypothetical protein